MFVVSLLQLYLFLQIILLALAPAFAIEDTWGTITVRDYFYKGYESDIRRCSYLFDFFFDYWFLNLYNFAVVDQILLISKGFLDFLLLILHWGVFACLLNHLLAYFRETLVIFFFWFSFFTDALLGQNFYSVGTLLIKLWLWLNKPLIIHLNTADWNPHAWSLKILKKAIWNIVCFLLLLMRIFLRYESVLVWLLGFDGFPSLLFVLAYGILTIRNCFKPLPKCV